MSFRRRGMLPASLAREADMEDACDDVAVQFGFGDTTKLSQPRKVRIARGLPDRRYRSHYWQCALFFEVKWGTRRLTQEQATFLRAELDAGAFASCGDASDLRAILATVHHTPGLHYAGGAVHALCRSIFEGWLAKGIAPH